MLIGLAHLVIAQLILCRGGPTLNTIDMSLALTADRNLPADGCAFNWGAHLHGYAILYDKT